MHHTQGVQRVESPHEFAHRIGLNFDNGHLLARALTHRSYLNENPEALEDNERLEFLGDAVLDFVVGEWLFHHLPEMPEGRLTSLRAALVRNEQLAVFAREIDLGAALRLGRGEAESGGRDRSSVLGSTFEALIGAMYIDGEIEAVRCFLEPVLESAVKQILEENRDRDAKSHLQEYTQAKGLGTPVYRTVGMTGPDHARSYKVDVFVGELLYGHGQGPSKQAATKAAAFDALNRLGLIE